jgi:hypothetical protein
MDKPRLSLVEKGILSLVLLIIIIGFVLYYTDLPIFEKYVEEDGIVEWLTVLGLLLGTIVCVSRFLKLRKFKNWWFLFVVIDMGLLLFFAAGEEISWGQRILGIKSSEFFLEKNSQGETNLHNLVVDGVKLNKLIFSIGLIIVMGIYLVVIPFLYKYNPKIKNFIDRSGIPLPRIYQVISILVVFLLTSLIPHEKKAELLEAGIALLLFLIIRYPGNLFAFQKLKPIK